MQANQIHFRRWAGLIVAVAVFCVWLPVEVIGAHGESAVTTSVSAGTSRKMLVAPCASSVALGRANLTVSPLSLNPTSCVGKYQLKVTPYVFKTEEGTLTFSLPEAFTQKLAAGNAVEFSGKATNEGNGKTKSVKGKVTPTNSERGAVTFSVSTEKGLMVFNTSYQLEP